MELSNERLAVLLDHDGVDPQEVTCAELESLIEEIQRGRASPRPSATHVRHVMASAVLHEFSRWEEGCVGRSEYITATAMFAAIANRVTAELEAPELSANELRALAAVRHLASTMIDRTPVEATTDNIRDLVKAGVATLDRLLKP